MGRQVRFLWVGSGVLLGLVVAVLLGGCTPGVLAEGDNLARELEDEERANPAATFEQRAERYCTLRAEADRAMVLYGLLNQQALAEDDLAGAEWLRGWLGERVFLLARTALLNDPRHVSLPAAQEPHRADLVALVCERCPETARATTEPQRGVFEASGQPELCADEPETVQFQDVEIDDRTWSGTLTIAQASVDAGPVACDFPMLALAAGTCTEVAPIPEDPDDICRASDVGQALPAVLGLPSTQALRLYYWSQDGFWNTSIGDPGVNPAQSLVPHQRLDAAEVTFGEGTGGGVFALEDEQTSLSGSVSGSGWGTTAISGTFHTSRPMREFVEYYGLYDSVCPGRVGYTHPEGTVHLSGTWTVSECDLQGCP